MVRYCSLSSSDLYIFLLNTDVLFADFHCHCKVPKVLGKLNYYLMAAHFYVR